MLLKLMFFLPFQLILEAHNVPELSAGVNCTFEDLAEMEGLVEGNRITCSSPAEKEVPRIVVDQGVSMHIPNCQSFSKQWAIWKSSSWCYIQGLHK